jgi:hypothetical protein
MCGVEDGKEYAEQTTWKQIESIANKNIWRGQTISRDIDVT